MNNAELYISKNKRKSLEEILNDVNEVFTFEYTLPLPRLDVELSCPVCNSSRTIIRQWSKHKRTSSKTSPFRCDLSYKCGRCSAVWTHGIVLTEEQWNRIPPGPINWFEGQKIILGEK